MIGRYHGPFGNAALAVINPVWAIGFCPGLLAGIGGAALYGNVRGRGEKDTAQAYFSVTLVPGAMLSALIMIAIGIFREQLLRFFGANHEIPVL
jgi:Na+-driven multidrug efflux pump